MQCEPFYHSCLFSHLKKESCSVSVILSQHCVKSFIITCTCISQVFAVSKMHYSVMYFISSNINGILLFLFHLQAALRNATTQGQVEMFEQEMTRMKLAHQQEIKVEFLNMRQLSCFLRPFNSFDYIGLLQREGKNTCIGKHFHISMFF